MRGTLRRPRNVILIVLILGALLGGWYWHEREALPEAVGNPDPGGRIMAKLTPTLDAIPTSVHPTDRQIFRSRWDSCDGVRSTFGWDDLTVSEEFDHVQSVPAFITQLETAFSKQGWHLTDGKPDAGPWYWQKKLIGGETATIQLLGGPGFQNPNQWSFEASSPAATHPVKGC